MSNTPNMYAGEELEKLRRAVNEKVVELTSSLEEKKQETLALLRSYEKRHWLFFKRKYTEEEIQFILYSSYFKSPDGNYINSFRETLYKIDEFIDMQGVFNRGQTAVFLSNYEVRKIFE